MRFLFVKKLNGIVSKFILMYLLLMLPFISSGQITHFKNLSRDMGLSNNFVRVIYEDNYGYMWFGTPNGLNRYDGVNIDEYKKTDDLERSLNGNTIYDLLHTSNGKLLIGNNLGLNVFNYKTEDFSKVEQLNSSIISKIIEDKAGNIWIVTGNDLVLKLDKELNKVVGFSFAALIKNQFDVATSNIRVFKYDEESLIVNVKGKGFYLFNLLSHEFSLKVPYRFKTPVSLVKVLKVTDSEFWLSTYSGVFVFRDNDLLHYFKSGGSSNDLNSPFVLDLKRVNSEEIWLFTDGGGINVYNLVTKKFRYIKQNARDEYSVNSNFLYSSFIAKNGTLWIGSVKNGVSQLIKNNSFVTYKLRDLKDGIRSDYPVSSLYLDDNDRVWIGSDGNGLYKYENDDVSHVYTDEAVKTINSISEYYPGHLLLGSYGRGIYTYDVTNRKHKYESILHKTITSTYNGLSIVKDVQGDFVINASKSIKVNGDVKDPSKFLKVKNILSKSANCSYVDKEQGLTLFGNGNGLYKYTEDDFILVTDVPRGVVSIQHFKDSLFWLATNKGVCLVNIDSGETIFYGLESGLNIEVIYSMVKSDSKNLWVGTYLGVSKFDVVSRKFTNYTYKNGFLDNEFIKPYAVKLKSGKLFFAGLKGVLSFDPKKIQEAEAPGKVIFTRLLINHEPLTDSDQFVVSEYIPDAKELLLDHTHKVLTVDFSTFEYAYPEKIGFSYKLEGYDSEWRETNNRSLTYMNLPVGRYSLNVKASNSVGDWGTDFSTIDIEVLPAWWQTWWFYLLLVLFISSVMFFIIWDILKRQAVRSNYEFEKDTLKRQLEFDESQIRFFTNLSHEIRTPLSLIVSPIRSIISGEVFNPENAKNLNLIEKNALRIEKLINRGIDFRKTQFKQPELQAVHVDIIAFLRDLVDGFSGMASVKNITLLFECEIPEQRIWFDKYMVETIFYNLISNAFKYSHQNGVIKFLITIEEENVMVVVQDFGDGISEEDLNRIFERFFQSKDHKGGSGIGLALSKQFVEAHDGEIKVESEKGKGTQFKVKLPFGDHSKFAKSAIVETDKVILEEVVSTEETPVNDTFFKNKSILIVEDELNLREYLKTNLGCRYNIIVAENGKVAYNTIQTEQIDLVVSDVTMPVMDGIELCKLLKEDVKTSGIPIILLTARILEADKIKGLDVGADAYISKPFHLDLLNVQIGNLLNRKEIRKKELLYQLGVEKSSETINNSDEKFYKQMIAIIEKHIGNSDFDVPMLASEIGMSKSLMYKRMSERGDMTINDLILKVRLNKAAQLLMHSKESIVDISNMVGFKNSKYFATSFKKKFDITPTKYRATKGVIDKKMH